MDLDKILAELGVNVDDAQEKTASAETSAPESAPEVEDLDKLAEDIEAAGALMAESFYNHLMAKTAMDRASSSHASSGGTSEPSKWDGIARKLQALKGGMGVPGDEGHTRAEAAYKRTMAKSPVQGGESY